MSLEWALGVLLVMLLVALVSFQLGRLSRSSSFTGRSRPKPSHPSVFVEMDDKPPMEIDFEAGIKASLHPGRKNPSQDEAAS